MSESELARLARGRTCYGCLRGPIPPREGTYFASARTMFCASCAPTALELRRDFSKSETGRTRPPPEFRQLIREELRP